MAQSPGNFTFVLYLSPVLKISNARLSILGGGDIVPIGTFAQYVAVERDQVILSPDYLDDEHAAAWPLGGVTAWR